MHSRLIKSGFFLLYKRHYNAYMFIIISRTWNLFLFTIFNCASWCTRIRAKKCNVCQITDPHQVNIVKQVPLVQKSKLKNLTAFLKHDLIGSVFKPCVYNYLAQRIGFFWCGLVFLSTIFFNSVSTSPSSRHVSELVCIVSLNF